MNIGRNILELRKQKNITQEELAAELGVTAAAVSKWENNYTLPDILMLCALADYFAVTTDELLDRKQAVKSCAVVARSDELADQICQLVKTQGFIVSGRFTAYRPALDHALNSDGCRHIFIGLKEPITLEEMDATPAHINAIQCFGNSDEDILEGFAEICNHPDLLTK